MLLDIINKESLHVLSPNPERKLLVRLQALLAKGMPELVMKRRREFALLLLIRIVIKSVRRLIKRSPRPHLGWLLELAESLISNSVVKRPPLREPLTFRERVELLGS